MSTTQAGKGDKPRNCFSENFRTNYDEINWGRTSLLLKRDVSAFSSVSDLNSVDAWMEFLHAVGATSWNIKRDAMGILADFELGNQQLSAYVEYGNFHLDSRDGIQIYATPVLQKVIQKLRAIEESYYGQAATDALAQIEKDKF